MSEAVRGEMVQFSIESVKILGWSFGVIGFLVLGYIGLVIWLYRCIGKKHDDCREERINAECRIHDRIDNIRDKD